MKRLLLVIVVTLSSLSSYAQFEKGRMLAGGAVGFSHRRTEMSDNGGAEAVTSLTLEPNFAYFVADRFALGGALTATTYRYTNDMTANKFMISPLLRYYFPNKFFLQLNIPFGVSSTDYGDGVSRYTALGASMGAGYAIFLNSHVALEPMIQLSSTHYKESEGEGSYLSSELSLRMAFQVYLGR